jgi:hypothetical protein
MPIKEHQMETENILSNYRYFVTPQQILFLHLKRDAEKIKKPGTCRFDFTTAYAAISYFNKQYGSSKFNTFLYEVTKDSIRIVDGNLNGTLNYWNRKLKESGSDMRYCTTDKNAVKYRNKLIERDSKETKSNDDVEFHVESKKVSDSSNVVTQRTKYSSESGHSTENISSHGVYYFVTRDFEIKSVELTAQTSIVAKIDGNIEAKINWYDTKNNCWLRETKEEAIDDLIEILSKKLQAALES